MGSNFASSEISRGLGARLQHSGSKAASPLKDKKKQHFQLLFISKLPFILSLFHLNYDQNHFKTPLKGS
jgi:hypothetical protein